VVHKECTHRDSLNDSKRLRQEERDKVDERVLGAVRRLKEKAYLNGVCAELSNRHKPSVVQSSLDRLVALGMIATGKDITRKDARGRPWYQISTT
jgi:hypothetical protein